MKLCYIVDFSHILQIVVRAKPILNYIVQHNRNRSTNIYFRHCWLIFLSLCSIVIKCTKILYAVIKMLCQTVRKENKSQQVYICRVSFSVIVFSNLFVKIQIPVKFWYQDNGKSESIKVAQIQRERLTSNKNFKIFPIL